MTRRPFWTLALAATLLCPIAAFADDAPAPATPAAVPAAPAPAPKPHNNVRGKITALDATAKTLTIESRRNGSKTITVADDAKIYKATDQRGQPTGSWSDLTVGLSVSAHLKGDEGAQKANEVHIQAPHQRRNKPAGAAAPVSLPAVP